MTDRSGVCLLLAALMACCIAPGASAAPPRLPRPLPAFVLTYWCGPPPEYATPARYREVKAAGFNLAMPPCAGGNTPAENLKLLHAAHTVGLSAFIGDSRMPMQVTGEKDALTRIDAIVRDYHAIPGFAGYFITDEPGAGAFPGLGEVVAALRARDPKHPAYINLFPDYASSDQLGVPTYQEYLQQFIRVVHPAFLSYDHYHFLNGSDRPTFFQNLNAVHTAAVQHHLPFWNIVLLTAHGPYRDLTEGEIRWEAFQSLAYGATGVVYFTYWTPHDDAMRFRLGAIEQDGSRTAHYQLLSRVNPETLALGTLLAGLSSERVYHTGNIPVGALSAPPDALLLPTAGDYTVGEFRDGRGRQYVLLVNGSYNTAQDALIQTRPGIGRVETYNPGERRWHRLLPAAGTRNLRITLEAGGGALFRLR